MLRENNLQAAPHGDTIKKSNQTLYKIDKKQMTGRTLLCQCPFGLWINLDDL
jgi:hypothetical protein